MKQLCSFFVLGIMLAVQAPAYTLHMLGDRVTLKADQVPLQRILRDLARLGVTVHYDPSINPAVTGDWEHADLQDVLTGLFDEYGYVLIWKMIDGPLGRLPALAELQLFQPGRKELMQQVADAYQVLPVVEGSGPAHVREELLLGLKPGTSVAELDRILAMIGGAVVDSNPDLGIYLIRLPSGANVPAVVALLEDHDAVAAAEPNYVHRLPEAHYIPGSDASEPLRDITPSGGPANVAVLDSGLLSGAGLDDVISSSFNALNLGQPVTDPAGHGTQMAGIASGAVLPDGAADTGQTQPVIAIQTFDENGNTSTFALMNAVSYAAERGARVINMSWGTEVDSDMIRSIVGYAQSKEIILVAAAGNEPSNQPFYPSALSGVISVAALDASGKKWAQSNYGSFINLAAPGTATFQTGHNGPPGSYAGTSIASAFVSYALGLYREKYPDHTPQQTLDALQSALQDAGPEGFDPYYGYGVLNEAALKSLLGEP